MGKHVKISPHKGRRIVAPAAALVAIAGVIGAPTAAFAHGDDGGGDHGGGGDWGGGGDHGGGGGDWGGGGDHGGGGGDWGDGGGGGDWGGGGGDWGGGEWQPPPPPPAPAPEPAPPAPPPAPPAAPAAAPPVAETPASAAPAVAPTAVVPPAAPPVEVVVVRIPDSGDIAAKVPMLESETVAAEQSAVPGAVGTGVALASIAGFAGLLVAGRARRA